MAAIDFPSNPLDGDTCVRAGKTWTYSSSKLRWSAEASGGGGTWGSITGTLSSQTDLQNALNAKSALAGSTSITTLGTITTGTWQGTAIADSYISSASTWNAKQAALVSGTNIKTVGSQSLLGSGNLTIANIGGEAALGNPAANGAALVSTTGGTRSWTGGALSLNSSSGGITTSAGGGITTGSGGSITTGAGGAISTGAGGSITTGTNGFIATAANVSIDAYGSITTGIGGSITTGTTPVNFITGVTVAQGGTGATTAANARTNLGAGATGDSLFTSATVAAANTVLGVSTRTKASATARTTSTESLDPELTGDTLDANTTYEVDFYFPITADAAGGIRFGFSVPSLLQAAGTFGPIIRESGAVSTATATSSTYINIRTVLAACTTGLSGHFRFRTGGSGGNFGVFWAQQTTNVAATTLLAGASYTITKR